MRDRTGMSDSTIRTTRISTGFATTIVARTCGQGETVVLIPSWARGASDFDQLIVALADAGYRAIAVNPRGIEGSEGAGLGRRKVSLEAHIVLESLRRLAAKIGQRKRSLAVSPELRPYQIKEGCFFIGGKSDATDTANPPIGLEIVWKQTNFANVRIHAYPPIP